MRLPPKSGIQFQFRANSTLSGVQSETWKLLNQVGEDRGKPEDLYKNVVLKGNFIEPSVSFSPSSLSFKYLWEHKVPIIPQKKPLIITCNCEQPVNFTLKIQPPFEIVPNNTSLKLFPGQQKIVHVEFDPLLKVDKKSGFEHQKLRVIHDDHPHPESIDVKGEFCFPNLKLEKTQIDFGCILNHTSKTKRMTLENISVMPVFYEWKFVDQSQKQGYKKHMAPPIPVNEVFDILPLNGTLHPGEIEDVEFIFNSSYNTTFNALAVCMITEGPPEEVILKGTSSKMEAEIEPSVIDLGDVQFNEW